MHDPFVSVSITINCAREVVWNYLTIQENWEKWYESGRLLEVNPAWEPGAILRFESGQKAKITAYAPPEIIRWAGYAISLSALDSTTTKVEYRFEPDHFFASDPRLMEGFRRDFTPKVEAMLGKLKRLVEADT